MKTNAYHLMSAVLLATAASSLGQPSMTIQPQNQTNLAGGSVIFSVVATGTPPLTYQWRWYTNATDFAVIPRAADATLVLTNVRPTNLRYGAVVANSEGSTNSVLAQLVVFPVNLPATPRNIMVVPDDRQVTVSWQPVPEATSYTVKRALTSSGAVSVIASNVTATSFINTNLSNGATYYYTVLGVSTNGESAESGRVSASPSAAVLDVLPAGAKLEKLAAGFQFTEGPIWNAEQGGFVIFSDLDGNAMYKWTPQETTVFRKPSNKANGNTRDRQGRLLTCEPQAGRIVRTEADGTVTPLVSEFNGTRFNGPNDIVVKSDGTVWFTDPVDTDYGWNYQPWPAVYRFDPATQGIQPVATNFTASANYPNGLSFSPDESKLFIADSFQEKILAFDVLSGDTLTNSRVFATVGTMLPQLPDGIRCDRLGRVFSSAANFGADNGVWIFDANGALLAKLRTPESVENLCFGGTNQEMLFITATTSLYGITRMPDLTIAAVNRVPASLSAGGAVTVSAVVKNQGTGPTPPGVIVRVRFALNNTSVFWSDALSEPLPPGGSVLLSWSNMYLAASAGANQLRAEVDVANEIRESNGTNNNMLVNFVVTAPGPDSDGDGLDDASESTAGTDPHNIGSALRILSSQLIPPSDFVVTWSSIPWKRYRVVSGSQATDFQWTEASGDIRATGTTASWTNTIPATNALSFYRVLVFAN